ncbi:siderophore ABC transporter substrate-binding protein [Psychrobacillus antarcticus]|uniref:siderophore ABC transporter substrate-binding protein n=1 Tax=Psychrobacillus antarcticus TaxID=2879115 RepID=UPI002407FF65|nr:ABC transporter substrate-binding protein [Psychrobacillus antarcticus]
MKKWNIITAAALALMLAACGSEETETPKASDTNKASETEKEVVEESAFPMTVSSLSTARETEEGASVTFEDITLEEEPKRIISLDYGFLDTLDALGVEGIVGVPAGGGKGNIPTHLKEKYAPSDDIADVGTLKAIDFEAVAAAEPDIIFISGRQTPFYEELKEITPNVVFIGSDNSNYIDAVYETVDLAANMFDKVEKGEELKAALQEKVDAVNEKVAGYENALVAMYDDKKMSGFDNGANSRFAYVYNDFGFKPATTDIDASSHGSDFSYESILSVDPEVLLVVDRTVSDVETIKADIENDIIKQTRAYKEGKIVYLDGTNWYFSSNGVTTEAAKLQEILDELK